MFQAVSWHHVLLQIPCLNLDPLVIGFSKDFGVELFIFPIIIITEITDGTQLCLIFERPELAFIMSKANA